MRQNCQPFGGSCCLRFQGRMLEVSFFETLVTAQGYGLEVISTNCTVVRTSDRISVVLVDASISRLLRVRRYNIWKTSVQTVNGEMCRFRVFTGLHTSCPTWWREDIRHRSLTMLVLERRDVLKGCIVSLCRVTAGLLTAWQGQCSFGFFPLVVDI
jgi:hypothetical protein